ncbi:tyrosine-type recombinase/integrase [Corynebacterium pseudopelargi]|uniref:Prophage phiRv2 integrase n=1 Tax=Corynebacterium pseudopelargi TaxID=2080757 RepID=A0A3G6IUG5_9CORY|nr:site-specific integrase [Corynebacterium pseudopelargi]AZA09322.1 Putative prophage phiRv2 integrase [Corynebacterium pseudopelargi]
MTRQRARKGHKRSSFGSVRELKSGRFQARFTDFDGYRRQAPFTFEAELDALAWLAQAKRLVSIGVSPLEVDSNESGDQLPTVGVAVVEWLEDLEIQQRQGLVRLSTLTTYRNIIDTRVLNHRALCSIRIDQLKPRHVLAWWNDIALKHPDTPDRNKRAYGRLKAVLAVYVERGDIPVNPVQIRAARNNPPKQDKRLAETAELQAILDAVPDNYRVATCLCLFHGLRIGEALALQRKHITQDNGRLTVTVEATLSRVPDGNGHVFMQRNPPKTKAGYRTVPVLKEFQSLIRRGVDKYTEHPEDYVTTTKNGAVVLDTSFRSMFHRAKDKAGVCSDITPHYGRNWLITRLAEQGATPKEIGRILGQTDVSTIVGVYMKVREHRPAELMEAVNVGLDTP